MTRKKNNYFQTFCNLSEAFGTAATVEDLLQLIVKYAVQTMDGKAACLFLQDKKQDIFVPKAKAGLSDTYMHANPLKAQRLSKALEQTGHLLFEDAANDERLENRDAKVAEGIASLMTVGVMVDGRMIGVLSLYTSDKRKFTDDEIVFLKALAANGGIALKKARLLERIEQNTLLFLDLASAINSSIDIKDILYNMTEKTSKAMGMKGATIRLLDQDSNTLNLVASYGLSDKFLGRGKLAVDKGLSEALKGKTIVIEDLSKSKDLQYPRETEKEGLHSLVTVPIQSKEETIGVMRLYSDSVRKYPQGFIMLIQALAHTGALAIQNASMYLALKEDKKSLEEDIWSHRLYF
ncbi:MAG: GAF domain-containing protein [Desulfobulbaceae bacterium]|nr:GAF domain-containing protein [Desulfobulbaceae bacterium]